MFTRLAPEGSEELGDQQREADRKAHEGHINPSETNWDSPTFATAIPCLSPSFFIPSRNFSSMGFSLCETAKTVYV